VRRAGDVLKAIALGATAVGIGRPFLCASRFFLPPRLLLLPEKLLPLIDVKSVTADGGR